MTGRQGTVEEQIVDVVSSRKQGGSCRGNVPPTESAMPQIHDNPHVSVFKGINLYGQLRQYE